MNKRNFIKSVVLGIISIPQIIYGDMFSVTEPNGPRIESDNFYYDILTPKEISRHFKYTNLPDIHMDCKYSDKVRKLGWIFDKFSDLCVKSKKCPKITNQLKLDVIIRLKKMKIKSLEGVGYFNSSNNNWEVIFAGKII